VPVTAVPVGVGMLLGSGGSRVAAVPEDHGINGGTTLEGIVLVDKLPYKCEVERFFEVPIEVFLWHQLF